MIASKNSRPATAADLLELIDRLGGIDPGRVRLKPTPGTATVKHLLRTNDGKNGRVCELIDRTLVEKTMGSEEDFLAAILITYLNNFVLPRKLGAVFGSTAAMRMLTRNVRLPDVSFIRAERWLEWLARRPAVVPFAPDLAVEILSKSNTRAEMNRKRQEYFSSGTRLVWEINPRRRAVIEYTSPKKRRTLLLADTLSGGNVLPGFSLKIAELFAPLSGYAS